MPDSFMVDVTFRRTLGGGVTYYGIRWIVVDHEGNLRLIRKRVGPWIREGIFHPAGEWATVTRFATPQPEEHDA